MLRVAISVEGSTELEFVKNVLQPYFWDKSISLQAINLRGNISIDKAAPELGKLLYNFDIVTTLYDFYRFKDRKDRKVSDLEKCLSNQVPEEKQQNFIPYIQQYEFEAFADIPKIPSHLLRQQYDA